MRKSKGVRLGVIAALLFGLGIGLPSSARAEAVGHVSFDDDDNGFGGWAGGGIFWRLGSRFNIGVGARFSAAEAELFGEEIEAGGFAGGLLLGWGWPSTP